MTFPAMRALVPQSDAMVLLDRVIAADAESLCAEVTIRPDSLFYKDKGVGAWIGIEYMAQTIAAYAGYIALQHGEPVKVGFLLGARRYECTQDFFALGTTLQIYARCLLQADNGLGSFECTISAHNKIIAQAIINAFQPDNLQQFLTGTISE